MNVNDIIKTIPDKKYQIKNSEILDEGKFLVVDQTTLNSGFCNDKSKVFFDVPVILFADHTGRLFYADKPFIIGCDGIKIIKLKEEKYNLKFFYYYLSAMYKNDGKYRRHFYTLASLPILFENSINQKNITQLLSFLDSKITNNKKINTELESTVKTLYDYWFLQFEFPNEEGKPYKSSGGKMVWNEKLKREIPEGWKIKKIKEILVESKKSKIQVNNAKQKGKYLFFTSGENILALDNYFVDGFHIFINTGGNPDIKAYKGKCAYSTDTWCVSANQYSYVLYYYLLKMMPQFEQLFFAGSGLKHLQKDAFKEKLILIPNDSIIKEFNEKCDSKWDIITNQIDQNKELSSLRDFLLPLLMNGQIKID